jgi:c-di-GMP-binding flagellar brake protein YcgR
MKARTAPYSNTKDQSLGHWFKQLFGFNKKLVAGSLDRRQAFRLDLQPANLLRLEVRLKNGETIKGTINNLSAGGISFFSNQSIWIDEGEIASISFPLHIKKAERIQTRASLIGTTTTDSNKTHIYRFCFSHLLSEKEQDKVHEFIFKTQIDQLRSKTN